MKSFIIIAMLCLILFPVAVYGQAARYSNLRAAGFGGAGIAVVPDKGNTPMQLNPAAPAYVKKESAWDASLVGGVEQPDEGDDVTIIGLLGEFYVPMDFFTMYGSGVFEHQSVTDISAEALLAGGGIAGTFVEDMIALGARADLWYTSYNYSGDYSDSLDFGPGVTIGLGGLLKTEMGFNLGISYNSESTDEKVVYDDGYQRITTSAGVAQTTRVGGAFQPENEPFLVGIEFENVSMEGFDYDEYHFYGEFFANKETSFRGGISYISEEDSTITSLSLGVGHDLGGNRLDGFFSYTDYDGASSQFMVGIGLVL
jgi:hypothetical protein